MSGPGEPRPDASGEAEAEIVHQAIDRPEYGRDDGPHIYVASLSDYNAGLLHGVWLDATDTVEGLQDGIDSMLATSPTTRRYGDIAEEWAVHDFEGFGRYQVGESESLETIAALAGGIERFGEAFTAWAGRQEAGELDRYDRFEEAYQGEFGSGEEYGEQLLEEQGIDVAALDGIPEFLRPYVQIDTAGLVRDMELGGDIWTEECNRGIYVFWSE